MSLYFPNATLAEVEMWIANFESARANWDRDDQRTYQQLLKAREEKRTEQRRTA